MNEVPKKFSDRPQGKAEVEHTNDIRKLGIYGFIRTEKGMKPLSRSQVNRHKKRRKHG